MVAVYRLSQSTDDLRPRLVLTGFRGSWDELLSTGNEERIDLVASPRDAVTDLYDLAGTLGVASARLSGLLRVWAGCGLRTRPATVNGQDYHILIRGLPSDVLDLVNSNCVYFPSSPERVMEIKSYQFISTRIRSEPWAFVVPESRSQLFINDAAAIEMRQRGMVGWDAVLLWSSSVGLGSV